jgi:nicotinamide phosphoribosyltransferase
MEAEGWASANLVFGVGSYTYQYLTRDSLGFAMKATWGIRGDQEVFLYKDPKTDNGTKKSARGRVAVIDGQLVDGLTLAGELDPMYADNMLAKIPDTISLEEIRANLRTELKTKNNL